MATAVAKSAARYPAASSWNKASGLKHASWLHGAACLLMAALCACSPQDPASTPATAAQVPAPSPPAVKGPAPVALADTQVLNVHDAQAGRDYPIWVSLPSSYAGQPQRQYPVLYVTDALYSFPLVRSIRNLVGQQGVNLEDFILVGLPPQAGLTSKQSRSRDYTPSMPARRGDELYSAELYGQAAHYRDFLADTVFAQVESRYRIDPARRIFAGHSLGGLFGSYVLLTRPDMFSTYILSSPSLWFDAHAIDRIEAQYAAGHRDLPARVLLSAGQYETQGPDRRYFKRGDMVGDNARFAAVLAARRYPGLRLQASVLPGEDHFTVYPSVMTRALLEVLPGQGPYTSG